jgi:phospholipid transport system substrate-binding protein
VLARACSIGALTGALAVAAWPVAVQAALDPDTPPDVLVKTVSTEVIELIRNDKDLQAGDSRKVRDLIETRILPQFDFNRMTALAMGASWRRATPEQQKDLVEQFRTLLVRTYASGVTAYRDQLIEFKPLRAKAGDTDVIVRSEVKRSGTQPVTIDYGMGKTPEGWKVYDVIIGGVSLVTTYRDTFVQEVRQTGVDGLIKMLADKNRQLEQQARK